ncbi:MAG: ATP-grasp domain-containing protein [Hungatella sp.]
MNLLLTSVGRRSYLVRYFKEVIGEGGVVCAANSSDLSPAFAAADRTVVTPLIYDDHYIPFLLDYCKKENIQVLLSLFDIDLPILSRHKAEFAAQGVQVIVSDPEVIDVCNDKLLMSIFLRERDFATPDCYLSVEEAKEAVEEGSLCYPVMIKPRWGMGSLSIYQADNEEELEVFYQKIKREIERSYLKYESEADLEHAVLIQQRIGGQEYGLDVIQDLNHIYQTTIVKEKIAMRSGETDCARVVDLPKLRELGAKIGSELGHIANLDMDIILSDGIPYIIDMNARFGGGYPYSHMAGVNLPRVILDWARGHKADPTDLCAESGKLYGKDIVMTELGR